MTRTVGPWRSSGSMPVRPVPAPVLVSTALHTHAHTHTHIYISVLVSTTDTLSWQELRRRPGLARGVAGRRAGWAGPPVACVSARTCARCVCRADAEYVAEERARRRKEGARPWARLALGDDGGRGWVPGGWAAGRVLWPPRRRRPPCSGGSAVFRRRFKWCRGPLQLAARSVGVRTGGSPCHDRCKERRGDGHGATPRIWCAAWGRLASGPARPPAWGVV